MRVVNLSSLGQDGVWLTQRTASRFVELVDLAFRSSPQCLTEPDDWMAALERRLQAGAEDPDGTRVTSEEAAFLRRLDRCMAARNGGLWGIPAWGWLVGAVGVGAVIGLVPGK